MTHSFPEHKQKMKPRRLLFVVAALLWATLPALLAFGPARQLIWLPSSKQLIEPVPGQPQKLNSFPVTVHLSPDQHFLAYLNPSYRTAESNFQQSIAVLDLQSNQITDFPDTRLGQKAHQSYFEGLAFSKAVSKLYGPLGSIPNPEGKKKDITENGIQVYVSAEGQIPR